MITEFSVRNFLSIHRRQDISFLPVGRNATQIETGATFEPHALPVIGLFGPNGAGKSNFVAAVKLFQDSLKYSGRLAEGHQIPFNPFAFASSAGSLSTEMELTASINGTIWRYGWEMSSTSVMREWLFSRNPRGKERKAFDRSNDSIEVANWVKGEKNSWKKNTLKNQLFLSKVAENSSVEFTDIFEYITKRISIISRSSDKKLGFITSARCTTAENLEVVQSFLQSLGVDIDGLHVEAVDDDEQSEGVAQGPANFAFSGSYQGKRQAYKVQFVRDFDGKADILFNIDDESSGNKLLFHLAGPMLDALNDGSVLVVDEIDNSLHSEVMRRIVELWSDTDTNRLGSQLMFTAHDTNIMNDGRLEKDQIYLVEKQDDRGTEIFSLAAFEFEDGTKPRRTAAFGKQYLSGRYGALPDFDPQHLLDKFEWV